MREGTPSNIKSESNSPQFGKTVRYLARLRARVVTEFFHLPRVRDMQKNIEGAGNELKSLTRMTEVINTKQLEDVYNAVEKNTKKLVDACKANERAAASLEVMQVVFAASMAFGLFDLATGLALNIDLTGWQIGIEENLIHPPGAWFGVNILWMLMMCYGLLRLMSHLGDKSLNFETFEMVLNLPIDIDAFQEFLSEKDLDTADGVMAVGADGKLTGVNKTAIWQEEDEEIWEGASPKMEVSYDATNGYLLLASFTVDRKNNKKTHSELKETLCDVLVHAGVMEVLDDE